MYCGECLPIAFVKHLCWSAKIAFRASSFNRPWRHDEIGTLYVLTAGRCSSSAAEFSGKQPCAECSELTKILEPGEQDRFLNSRCTDYGRRDYDPAWPE